MMRTGGGGFRIVSGAQTGVDRAALDAALEAGLAIGGWVPRGRLAEDGRVPARYPLKEADSPKYAVRTRWNVRDSDATLVITRGWPSGGTAWTIACAESLNRPLLVVDLEGAPEAPDRIVAWAALHRVRVLNVAGPRESTSPGIYQDTRVFLAPVLCLLAETPAAHTGNDTGITPR